MLGAVTGTETLDKTRASLLVLQYYLLSLCTWYRVVES